MFATRKGDFGGGFGNALSKAGTQLTQDQVQERANRQNDLQQLQGAYQMLKSQEFGKMLAAKQAGQQYTPNPMLPQMETKLAQLTGLGNLSGGTPSGINQPPAPQVAPPQAMPQGPQMSTPQNPQFAVPPALGQPQALPQKDASGIGGPAGGLPMEAWLAMDPTGAKYMAQLAKDNAPIVLRQGDLVKKNPDGTYSSAYQQPMMVPGVVPTRNDQGQATGARELPGFAPAISNIKGAETGAVEGAKFPYSTVETATGAKVPAFLAGIKPPGQAQPPGVASLTVTQPSQNAAPQPPNAQSDVWSTIPKRYVAQGVGASIYDSELSKEQVKQTVERQDKYGQIADQNATRLALNAQARDMVDKADTGWMANNIAGFRNFLATVGVPDQDIKAGNDQVLTKDLANSALQKGKQLFGSRFTQSEVGIMLNQANPSAQMRSVAIKFLLDTDSAMAKYGIQQANDFGTYIQKGGDPGRFEGWYARQFPPNKALAGLVVGGQQPPTAGGFKYLGKE
ncbi:MAG TPA: hypothetical protein VHV32_18920 [Candidatus Angelobacter sp.]|nr:hypothetical protein [Candidatus Angelobacter sp.]